MEVSVINDIIYVDDDIRLLKILLYTKLSEKGISLHDSELNVLSLFARNNDKTEAIEKALSLGFVTSRQSAENYISKLVKGKLLEKVGLAKRKIPDYILPTILTKNIAVTYKIHNIERGNNK